MDELPIIYSLDNKYAQHCAAGIASLLKNISDQYYAHIYIITDSLSNDNRNKLQKTAEIKNCKLSFLDIDPINNEFSGFLLPKPWSRSILYRLKIPSLLASHTKAIYLDADTIITCNISELFNMDISNYLLGAVDEYDIIPEAGKFQSNKLGLPTNIGYFNSGVMLLNLNAMRKEYFEQKCLDLLNSDMRNKLTFPDQDVLNIVTDGNFLHLPKTWNTQTWAVKNFTPLIRGNKKLPNIIHFSGPSKPWERNKTTGRFNICQQAPYTDQYLKYLSYTPWNNSKQNILRKFTSVIKDISIKTKRLVILTFNKKQKNIDV